MEETVETSAPATVFAFGPEESAPVDEVQEAAPVGEEAQESEQQMVEAEESAEGVDTQPSEQDKVSKAIGKEKHRIREQARQEYEKKLSEDPVRQLGKLMLDDLMTNKDLSEEDAIKEATDNLLKAIAKRDGVSVGVAKRLYGQQVKQTVQQTAEEPDIDTIVEEVRKAPKPEGFDESVAYQDDSFLELLQEMPAKAAIRVWMAERKAGQAGQDIAEKLRARNAIPQAIRPQKPVTPKTDWTTVSREDFLAEKARRQKFR